MSPTQNSEPAAPSAPGAREWHKEERPWEEGGWWVRWGRGGLGAQKGVVKGPVGFLLAPYGVAALSECSQQSFHWSVVGPSSLAVQDHCFSLWVTQQDFLPGGPEPSLEQSPTVHLEIS